MRVEQFTPLLCVNVFQICVHIVATPDKGSSILKPWHGSLRAIENDEVKPAPSVLQVTTKTFLVVSNSK